MTGVRRVLFRSIHKAQTESFPEEINSLIARKPLKGSSKLASLNPMIDDDGLLRANGRLQLAGTIPWETRYPIILPRNHQITQLIVKKTHERCQHGGTNLVLSGLSAKYWVLSAREAIREWEKKCSLCQRLKATPGKQVMAPLPEIRTGVSMHAFSRSSVDFAGPFETKQGRGKVRQKRYLCLFTCLETRAVHLEMAYSLSTDAFLNAFYRMTARRGMPEVLVSDNGTNFVGAHNELKDLVNALDAEKIQNQTSNHGVKWQFNPPYAPHFNGVHEIMAKAAKRAMWKILSNADITDEELLSAIVGAEGLINSRPLTYQSANHTDVLPLTPNHFPHGQVGGQFAPESVDKTSFHPRQRWRRVQELVRHFWGRWMEEWLPSLNSRKKWHREHRDFKAGDVVLLLSPGTPRGQWPLGRITQTYPGPDGHVRTVDVRTGGTTIRRPVVKLCPLDIQ